MIYIGNNEIAAFAIKKICSSISQQYDEISKGSGLFCLEDLSETLIERAEQLYIFDITAFSDSEETIVAKIDKLHRAVNADIIIYAPGMSENSHILVSLAALGFTKIITEEANRTLLEAKLRTFIFSEKTSQADSKEELIENRESFYQKMCEENRTFAQIDQAERQMRDTGHFDDDLLEGFIAPSLQGKEPPMHKCLHEDNEKTKGKNSAFPQMPPTGNDFPKHQRPAIKRQNGIIKIAVVGSMKRIGTTTVAMQFTKFLNLDEEQSACYLEHNSTGYVSCMRQRTELDKDDPAMGKISLDNVDLFYKPKKIADIMQQGYRYVVYDYGDFHSCDETSLLDKDIIILVGGFEADEMDFMTDALKELDAKNIFYVFNFVDWRDREEVTGMMEYHAAKTYFLDYCPSRYTYNPKHEEIFLGIINSDYEKEDVTKGKGKKKRRLFR